MRGSSSCPPTQPIRVHQGCSVQANHSRRRSSIQWLQQNGAPFSGWEKLSHSCYGKCSLAVIPLVTGHGSPASLLDRRRGGGGGESLRLSVHNDKRSVHAQQNRLECVKHHLWVKKKQLFEAASELALARWANHQAAAQKNTLPLPESIPKNTDSVRVGKGWVENTPHTPKNQTKQNKKTQTYKTSL